MNKFLRVGLRRINSNPWKLPQTPLTASVRHSSSAESSQTFEEVTRTRRKQADRSVIVQVNSEKSFPELFSYCSQFGQIEGCHHYKVSNDELHYVLIEFGEADAANTVLNSSCYNEDLAGVPTRSPFVWFRAGKKKLSPAKSATDSQALKVVDGVRNIPNDELEDLLLAATNLDDQIQTLHRATCLNDVGIRLRYLAARQIESAIVGMFPNANALPFGSTVNGFGKMGCDLDLILRFDQDRSNSSDGRFVFHTKETLGNGRSQTQRQMECISDLLQLFLPGVCHVRRILQARVPIIKYHHEHLDLEVDLSMSNLTGVYMSELLYMFGQLDTRVRPLTFCLRRWAQSCGLTNPSPGRWITNFSLTCLVIFFLQRLKQPILPAINLFTKSAKPSDIRITEDGINCTFIRSTKDLQFTTKNKSSLSELLLQFFEFYSQFDFNNRAISLNEGRGVVKPDHSAVYIVNPLEQILNVSKNISLEECERFRIEVRNSAWILESEIERNTSSVAMEGESSWGLLNLFRTPEKAIIRPNMFYKPRMVDVSDLFEDTAIASEKNVEFKNGAVRNQVRGIRTQMKTDLKQLRADASSKGPSGRRR